MAEMLRAVGISSPEQRLGQYIHELSGGMRQRVMIAMALLCRPRLMIADEPTTALDVTTEAQIIRLIGEVSKSFRSSVLLITHNMGLVAEICDRVAVLYAGSRWKWLLSSNCSKSPFTPTLADSLSSIVTLDTQRGLLRPIPGRVPSPREQLTGCRFHPRCPQVEDLCRREDPSFVEVRPGHHVSCFLWAGPSASAGGEVSE